MGEAVLMAVKQHPDAKRSYLADEEPTKLCLTKKRLTPSDPSVLFETEHPNVWTKQDLNFACRMLAAR